MKRAQVLLLTVLMVAAFGMAMVSLAAPVSLTVPYSATAVSDAHLDGDPATGAWSDALSTPIPLENAAAAPYGTATLTAKHDGANLFLRIDGSVDVPWTSATGSHFWLGFQFSPTGTSHHGSGTWDGTFFGLWDGTDYLPQATYPPAPVDTNGFDRPPTKDATQNAIGALRTSGSSPPYAFTAEWRRPLASGDADDLSYVADGATTYNFFVTTDSDGSGSSGGSIGHRGMTNLNTLRLEQAPSPNAPPTLGAIARSPAAAIPGQDIALTSASSDSDGDVLAYTWSFGDGSAEPGTSPPGGGPIAATHAYSAARTYPVSLVVDDGRGGTATRALDVVVLEPAFLRATTNPAAPGKILVDGIPRDEWGLTWVKMAPGDRVVSFGDVYGLETPAPQSVALVSGMTTEAPGNYIVHGFLRVTTEPAVPGTIYVDGQPANDWGMWRSILPGTYTISYGAVAGFTPPAPETVTIAAGEFRHLIGRYTSNPGAPGPDPSTFGYLRVTTNPAVPSQISVNGIPRDEWGLTWVKVAPGMYTVSFKGVYGFTTPAAAAVAVVAGATAVHEGAFLPHGSLRILTSPALPATVYVDGVPRNDWGMWQSMPPGTYKVSYGAVAGYVMPAPQVITVDAYVLSTATGVYVQATSGVADIAEGPTVSASRLPAAGAASPTLAIPAGSDRGARFAYA